MMMASKQKRLNRDSQVPNMNKLWKKSQPKSITVIDLMIQVEILLERNISNVLKKFAKHKREVK